MIVRVYLTSVALKLLAIPSYFSTDFEVHRHWLALTSTLPWTQWYTDKSSEWTMDYPPFFAWFEYILGKLCQFSFCIKNQWGNSLTEIQNITPIYNQSVSFDGFVWNEWYRNSVNILKHNLNVCFTHNGLEKNGPQFMNLSALNNSDWDGIIFQRMSVIFTDVFLIYSIWHLQKSLGTHTKKNLLPAFILLSPGLFFLDNIHFQYNGFLFSFFFMSLSFIIRVSHERKVKQKNYLASALYYLILVNLKHIFLYLAPAYGILYLRAYVRIPSISSISFIFKSFSFYKLLFLTLSIFGVSLGPFAYHGLLSKVLERLFPFGRGITHAYWAPNFWALYLTVDRAFGFYYNVQTSSVTRGLVGDVKMNLLPEISPFVTFLLTLLFQMPTLHGLWKHPNENEALKAIMMSGFSSFMFGWHVHEKAILIVLFTASVLYVNTEGTKFVSKFRLLTLCAYYSLFPLLFKPFEMYIKVLCLSCFWIWLNRKLIIQNCNNIVDKLLCFGFLPLFLFTELIRPAFLPSFEFLSLMLTSCYCAFVNVYLFITLTIQFKEKIIIEKEKYL
ncbi:ALG6, ALG8 glycosyltransferase [Rozella allomycis CSF55]|uniref:Alpha-1,3-glucosyltransferase n=1 Tax=Rozella allomycis (strain CSF55) TaxID=988480 RepID=A0A4P9YHT6_ROZAC|nr:ALG6, ALG8 glycosyltransferase [Rozella allomycis CSF55]